MGLQQRRQFETYLRTGRRLVVVDDDAATEVKFNPNHDPDDGRFTYATGGGETSGGEIVVTAHRPHPSPAKPAAAPVKGPFKRRPNEVASTARSSMLSTS